MSSVGSWEAAAHRADGEEKQGEKGSEVGGGSYGGPVARAERKMGAGGPGFSAAWRGKTGEREGAPDAVGDSSGGRHWPPSGGRGWRRCRATGEGGGARWQ
jgi:hypothetical protein